MKILFDCRRILFVLIAFFGLACTYAGSLDGRLIDDGWFFRLNPYGNVTEAAFDHSTWQAVDLPHDWSQAFDFTPEATTAAICQLAAEPIARFCRPARSRPAVVIASTLRAPI